MSVLVLVCGLAACGYAQEAKDNKELVPGKRMVRAVQFPYDIKVKFPLYATGRLEGIAGSAEVRRRKSGIEVEVNLEDAPAASQLKTEYRGYVVWALTPAGKFVNLGSLERNGTLKATTTVPTFGIVVSAEADLKAAASEPDSVLESGYPSGKWRLYPMQRVLYTPRAQ